MRFAFRLGNQCVDSHYIVLYFLRQIQMSSDNMLNVQAAVVVTVIVIVIMLVTVVLMMVMGKMVMFVMYIMAFFFLAVNRHANMCSRNAAFYRRFLFDKNVRNSKRIQFFHKLIRIGNQFKQRGSQHIPRRTHRAVKIKCFHYSPPISSHSCDSSYSQDIPRQSRYQYLPPKRHLHRNSA